jgi:hypothetical protein
MDRRTFIKGALATVALASAPAGVAAPVDVDILRRHIQGCQDIGGGISSKRLPNRKERALKAAELLRAGEMAPFPDVQRLVVDLIPSVISHQQAWQVDAEHRMGYVTAERLVERGGKRKIEALRISVIGLQELVDFGILTNEGAQIIREGRCEVFMPRCLGHENV